MTGDTGSLSTSERRRETVIESAIAVFARAGYLGTPIADVAAHAQISTAYVFKLFPGKVSLFVAALDRCFDKIHQALSTGAEGATSSEPNDILYAMGGAYADLIADRNLLLLQVHALSAADVPEIAAAMQRGLETVTIFAQQRSAATSTQVQHFMAIGQLCHLITTLGLTSNPDPWAALLTEGIRHSEPERR